MDFRTQWQFDIYINATRKKKFLSYRCPLYTEFSYWDFTNRHIFVYPQMEFLS